MQPLDRQTLAVALLCSGWLGLGPGACYGESAVVPTPQNGFQGPVHATRRGGMTIVETPNFRVSGELAREVAIKIATRSERLRAELSAKWLPESATSTWEPRCEIVLHVDLDCYLAAVGRAGSSTVGSAQVTAAVGGSLRRRIDLRGDVVDRAVSALPHEMTHVVLADAFGDERLPLWADEGMAILADPADKRRRHADDVRRAVANGRHFEPGELLARGEYPPADRWGTYYGQSVAAVEYLVGRKSAPDFLGFLRVAKQRGYDAALREVYDLRDASALRAAWGPNLRTVSDRNE